MKKSIWNGQIQPIQQQLFVLLFLGLNRNAYSAFLVEFEAVSYGVPKVCVLIIRPCHAMWTNDCIAPFKLQRRKRSQNLQAFLTRANIAKEHSKTIGEKTHSCKDCKKVFLVKSYKWRALFMPLLIKNIQRPRSNPHRWKVTFMHGLQQKFSLKWYDTSESHTHVNIAKAHL